MNRICLYYRKEQDVNRCVPGDRLIRPLARRIIRGKPRPGGIDKVFHNLRLGLDRLGAKYVVNLPFSELRMDDRVGVLGRGRQSLRGYEQKNPIVAGIGLMTHPSEWPTLCDEFPVKCYLQHSAWANDVYRPYFGDRCAIWPVGIDTEQWLPQSVKDIDLLIYDKIMWNRDVVERELSAVICDSLSRRRLTAKRIRYGNYTEREYGSLLGRSKGMIFLCEHESQGLAYQECLSCGVPVLAWDQGWCLDPNRFTWGQSSIRATSVPYFDERCGERFSGPTDFDEKLSVFLEKIDASAYRPRDFVLEALTLRGSAERFVSFFE